jgi:hypothetical protein
MQPKPRTCSWCGAEVTQACPHCTEWIFGLPDTDSMTIRERAEELWDWLTKRDRLEIEFELVHHRISNLVGRPVFTHELAESLFPLLIEEVCSGNEIALKDIFDKVNELRNPPQITAIVTPEESNG